MQDDIEFNSEAEGPSILRNSVLEVVDRYTYLGQEVSREGIVSEKQMKMNEGKAKTGMIMNVKSRTVNKYEVSRSLWKGMAVSYCLYESEITFTRREI